MINRLKFSRGRLKVLRSGLPTLLDTVALIVGFSILAFVRSPDALVHPILYAEDGVWFIKVLDDGWLNAATNARIDYPTFLHVTFLAAVGALSFLFSGSSLWLAAIILALVGYLIWGSTAWMIYHLFRRSSGVFLSGSMAVGFIFIPLGNTANETLGRVLQLGFLIPVWLLLIFLAREERVGPSKLALDVAIIFLNLSSPIVTPITFAYLAWKLFSDSAEWRRTLRDWVVPIVGIFVSTLLIAARPPVVSAIPGGLQFDGLVETVIWRSLLYPIIAPIYQLGSDVTAIFAAILVAVAVLMLLGSSKGTVVAKKLAITLIVFAASLASTLLSRPGLTAFLDGYTGSYPDRYYLGLNTLSWLLFGYMTVAAGEAFGKSRRNWILPANSFLVISVLANALFLSDTFVTRLVISHGDTWQMALCDDRNQLTESGLLKVILEPSPDWFVSIQPREIEKLPCP